MNELKRMPKYFEADESCFMFLSKGAFRLRTPDRIIDFIEGDGMLAKCGPYYVEKSKDDEGSSAVIAVYFHPSIVKGFFPIDLSLAHFKPNYNPSQYTLAYEISEGMPGMVSSALNHWQLRTISAEQTQLIMRIEMEVKGLMGKIMQPMMRMQMSKLGAQIAEEFKYYVEHGNPHPRKLKALQKQSGLKTAKAAA